MENRPGRRTYLYVLAELFCLLLVVGLVLLYVHHRGGSAGRNAKTTPADWSELPVPTEGAARLTVLLEEIPLQEVNEPVRYSFLGGDSVSYGFRGATRTSTTRPSNPPRRCMGRPGSTMGTAFRGADTSRLITPKESQGPMTCSTSTRMVISTSGTTRLVGLSGT